MSSEKWYQRKDGTAVYKVGGYKILEIFKRPHGKFCCRVWDSRYVPLVENYVVASEGYHGTFLSTFFKAKNWGLTKAKSLGIII